MVVLCKLYGGLSCLVLSDLAVLSFTVVYTIDCDEHPCYNGGSCRDDPNGDYCECEGGSSGPVCNEIAGKI